MAEGVLGGLLSGEEEVAEAQLKAELLAGADAFAIATVIEQTRHNPKVAEATLVFLQKQARMLEVQTAQAEAEQAVRLHHLHDQAREGRLRRAGQSIRLGMQLFVALAASLAGIGVLVLIFDAVTSRSVVVGAFSTPAALAERGITGEAVASSVLDTLQSLQEATRTSHKGLETKNAWSSDIKVELPETGVSLGEIKRFLQQRFGHDVHVGGDLIQTDTGGLTMTVRGDGVAAKSFSGGAGDLGKLAASAAEYIYSRSQPDKFSLYLNQANRYTDNLAFLPGAFARATNDPDRARFMQNWANAYIGLGQMDQAAKKQRQTMLLDVAHSKQWWQGWAALVGIVAAADGEEAAWREGHAMLQGLAASPKRDRPALLTLVNPAQLTWDLPLYTAALVEDAAYNGGAGLTGAIDGPQIADAYVLLHDKDKAARYMAASDPEDSMTKAQALLMQGYAALDRNDAAGAVAPLESFNKAWLTDPNVQYAYNDNACYLGLAYGLSGRKADAEDLFRRMAKTPWSRCYAFQGDALAQTNDVAGAQRVWAEGIRLMPDLPHVYLHRGIWEASSGNLKAAEADVSTATANAPHFADPLKAWGDLLTSEGHAPDALHKYNEALKYAPNWPALQQARDAAARKP